MIVWGWFDGIFSTVVNLLFFLTIVTTIMVVLLENRNPLKTLVWVLVLTFLPVVGLVLYFFFGQDTRREKLISKKGYERLSKYPMMEFQVQESFELSEQEHLLMRFFHRVNRALPFEGNAIQVYSDGYSMIQALLESIYSAKHHIHLQYYIFEDDAVGYLVRDALMDKAREGVEIRVLYDDVGSWKVPHVFFDGIVKFDDVWHYEGVVLKISGRRRYWAPSIIEYEGRYYIYFSYSAPDMFEHMYVAEGETPLGPFRNVTKLYDRFAIDSHVVKTEAGLFIWYAENNEADERAGTRVFVDKLIDPFTPANICREVIIPTRDEEITGEKDGRPWHTLEGPFYFREGEWHYVMYSGGSFTDNTSFHYTVT